MTSSELLKTEMIGEDLQSPATQSNDDDNALPSLFQRAVVDLFAVISKLKAAVSNSLTGLKFGLYGK